MRDELIATVSHELRTPLTSILGYTEILVDMGEPAISGHAARLLEIVRRNAERELKLVEDLLTVSLLGGAGLTVEPVPTDLAQVVDTVLDELAPMASESGIALTRSGEPSLWVVGDASRLADVVTNVVMNAVKFSRPCGGQVDIGLLAEGDHGVVVVHDRGMGIDAHELPQLFDPLYRTAGAVAAAVPGRRPRAADRQGHRRGARGRDRRRERAGQRDDREGPAAVGDARRGDRMIC